MQKVDDEMAELLRYVALNEHKKRDDEFQERIHHKGKLTVYRDALRKDIEALREDMRCKSLALAAASGTAAAHVAQGPMVSQPYTHSQALPDFMALSTGRAGSADATVRGGFITSQMLRTYLAQQIGEVGQSSACHPGFDYASGIPTSNVDTSVNPQHPKKPLSPTAPVFIPTAHQGAVTDDTPPRDEALLPVQFGSFIPPWVEETQVEENIKLLFQDLFGRMPNESDDLSQFRGLTMRQVTEFEVRGLTRGFCPPPSAHLKARLSGRFRHVFHRNPTDTEVSIFMGWIVSVYVLCLTRKINSEYQNGLLPATSYFRSGHGFGRPLSPATIDRLEKEWLGSRTKSTQPSQPATEKDSVNHAAPRADALPKTTNDTPSETARPARANVPRHGAEALLRAQMAEQHGAGRHDAPSLDDTNFGKPWSAFSLRFPVQCRVRATSPSSRENVRASTSGRNPASAAIRLKSASSTAPQTHQASGEIGSSSAPETAPGAEQDAGLTLRGGAGSRLALRGGQDGAGRGGRAPGVPGTGRRAMRRARRQQERQNELYNDANNPSDWPTFRRIPHRSWEFEPIERFIRGQNAQDDAAQRRRPLLVGDEMHPGYGRTINGVGSLDGVAADAELPDPFPRLSELASHSVAAGDFTGVGSWAEEWKRHDWTFRADPATTPRTPLNPYAAPFFPAAHATGAENNPLPAAMSAPVIASADDGDSEEMTNSADHRRSARGPMATPRPSFREVIAPPMMHLPLNPLGMHPPHVHHPAPPVYPAPFAQGPSSPMGPAQLNYGPGPMGFFSDVYQPQPVYAIFEEDPVVNHRRSSPALPEPTEIAMPPPTIEDSLGAIERSLARIPLALAAPAASPALLAERITAAHEAARDLAAGDAGAAAALRLGERLNALALATRCPSVLGL